MSVERHPNLNAAGFVTDVYTALQTRMRGAHHTLRELPHEASTAIIRHIMLFVNNVDTVLDYAAESKHTTPPKEKTMSASRRALGGSRPDAQRASDPARR